VCSTPCSDSTSSLPPTVRTTPSSSWGVTYARSPPSYSAMVAMGRPNTVHSPPVIREVVVLASKNGSSERTFSSTRRSAGVSPAV